MTRRENLCVGLKSAALELRSTPERKAKRSYATIPGKNSCVGSNQDGAKPLPDFEGQHAFAAPEVIDKTAVDEGPRKHGTQHLLRKRTANREGCRRRIALNSAARDCNLRQQSLTPLGAMLSRPSTTSAIYHRLTGAAKACFHTQRYHHDPSPPKT
jgi:hypothetical protein